MKIYKISEINSIREPNIRYAMTAQKAIEIVNEMRNPFRLTATKRDTARFVNVNAALNDILHYVFHAVSNDIIVDIIDVEE